MTDAARTAVREDGADTPLLGCTALEHAGILLHEVLARDGFRVTVIEALPPTIGLAATLVRSGLAHAKAAFPVPPAKATPGYTS